MMFLQKKGCNHSIIMYNKEVSHIKLIYQLIHIIEGWN